MKVLMFGWEFPPHIAGGLGTACFGLTKGLAKQQVQVIFVVPKVYGDEDQTSVRILNASDVSIDLKYSYKTAFNHHIQYIDVNSRLIPYVGLDEYYKIINGEKEFVFEEKQSIYNRKYEFSGNYGANLLDEVARYALIGAELGKTEKFDVIHAHDWLTYQAGIAARNASGKPLVVHIHATEFDRSGQNINNYVFDIEKRGMMEADLVCTVSHFTRQIVIEKYGIPESKVVTLHNAVEPGGRAVARNKKVPEKIVTFLGRVTFQKGPEYFVEAAKKVLDKDSNVRFVLAGDGDLMQKTIKRVAELGIADRFHFTGFLRGTDIDKMFGMSDVYVMPSISEPFGISPLEAMRSNVPVVISKQSGVAEVLQHALKVDFWDIDAMSDAIYGLLHYEALADKFIREGREEVDNLKWEHVANKLKSLYYQLINR